MVTWSQLSAKPIMTPLPQSSGYIHTEGDPTLENTDPKVIIEDPTKNIHPTSDPEEKKGISG